jgi:hypothetical protein
VLRTVSVVAVVSGSLSARLAGLNARLLDPVRCDVFGYRQLRFEETSTPTLRELFGEHAGEFSRCRRRVAESRDPSRNGELVRVLSSDLRRGTFTWCRSDYLSLLAGRDLVNEYPSVRVDAGVSMHILLAVSDGWFVTRRSRKVLSPGLWQHAAAETVEPADLLLDNIFDPRLVAVRALREELGVDRELDGLHPWIVQRILSPTVRHVFYVVADARELSFDDVTRLRRRAKDAWESDGAAVLSGVSEWSGREVSSGLVVPTVSPRSLLRSLGQSR